MRLLTTVAIGTALSTSTISFDTGGSIIEGDLVWSQSDGEPYTYQLQYPKIELSGDAVRWYLSTNEQRAMKKALYMSAKVIS